MRSHLVNFLQSVFRSNLVSKISIVSCVINTQINNAILFTGQPFEQSSSSQHGVVVAGHIGDRRTQNTLALFALEQIEIAFQFHLHLLIKRPMGVLEPQKGHIFTLRSIKPCGMLPAKPSILLNAILISP